MKKMTQLEKKFEVELGKEFPKHELFHIGALLAIVGGFLDSYTFILRGGVFANAQTGNIMLLAIYAADGQVRRASYFIVPILAFAAGVLVTEYIKHRFLAQKFKQWERLIILIEICLLSLVGLIPMKVPNEIVNILISFVCSMQVNSFRKVKHLPYASTMCTGNLRSAMEQVSKFLLTKDKCAKEYALQYFGIIGFFSIGAFSGALLANLIGMKSIWICSFVLLLVLYCMRDRENVK